MALIKCNECSKEISDKAPACPNCGAPQAAVCTQTVTNEPVVEQKKEATAEKKMLCPKCYSDQLTSDKKGFSAGKAIVGGLLVGPLGLAGGFLGSKKLVIYCVACGHKFKPGEHATRKPTKTEEEAGNRTFAIIGTTVIVFFLILIVMWLMGLEMHPGIAFSIAAIIGIGCGILVWVGTGKKKKQASVLPPSSYRKRKKWTCPKCGNKFKDMLDACKNCGTPMTYPASAYWNIKYTCPECKGNFFGRPKKCPLCNKLFSWGAEKTT